MGGGRPEDERGVQLGEHGERQQDEELHQYRWALQETGG